jgi:hypothetical protein
MIIYLGGLVLIKITVVYMEKEFNCGDIKLINRYKKAELMFGFFNATLKRLTLLRLLLLGGLLT